MPEEEWGILQPPELSKGNHRPVERWQSLAEVEGGSSALKKRQPHCNILQGDRQSLRKAQGGHKVSEWQQEDRGMPPAAIKSGRDCGATKRKKWGQEEIITNYKFHKVTVDQLLSLLCRVVVRIK